MRPNNQRFLAPRHSTQVKHWGDEMTRYMYDLSSVMWAHHHIPGWWQDRLMTFLPKTQGTDDLDKTNLAFRGNTETVGWNGSQTSPESLAATPASTPQSTWVLTATCHTHSNSACAQSTRGGTHR
jgi:hypothetical protein